MYNSDLDGCDQAPLSTTVFAEANVCVKRNQHSYFFDCTKNIGTLYEGNNCDTRFLRAFTLEMKCSNYAISSGPKVNIGFNCAMVSPNNIWTYALFSDAMCEGSPSFEANVVLNKNHTCVPDPYESFKRGFTPQRSYQYSRTETNITITEHSTSDCSGPSIVSENLFLQQGNISECKPASIGGTGSGQIVVSAFYNGTLILTTGSSAAFPPPTVILFVVSVSSVLVW